MRVQMTTLCNASVGRVSCASTACAMHNSRPRQQRLCTGALFPEEVNKVLIQFARRNGLHSSVWVQHRAFELYLQPYREMIQVVAHPAFCHLLCRKDVGDKRTITRILGCDCVLVNADHTTNRDFIEGLRDRIVPPLMQTTHRTTLPSDVMLFDAGVVAESRTMNRLFAPTALRERGGRVHAMPDTCTTGEVSDPYSAGVVSDVATTVPTTSASVSKLVHEASAVPTFVYPITQRGAPFSDEKIVRSLRERQKAKNYHSNYWEKRLDRAGKVYYLNAEETGRPGHFNPVHCVEYLPHNYTGLPFPRTISLLMRQRAVLYGYVSRTWLTLHEAEHVFHTTLRQKEQEELIYDRAECVVYSNYFNGGLATMAFYCADEFAQSEQIIPTSYEMRLMRCGARVRRSVYAGYPLLDAAYAERTRATSLSEIGTTCSADERTTAAHAYNGGETCAREPCKNVCHAIRMSLDRPAATTTSTYCASGDEDVIRKDTCNEDTSSFQSLLKHFKNICVFGRKTCVNAPNLLTSSLYNELRRQCILRNFPSPNFIHTRDMIDLGLEAKMNETGIPQDGVRSRMYIPFAYLQGMCWFNFSQLTTPRVALELMYNRPRHALTRMLLKSKVATRCAALALYRGNTSRDWLPMFVLLMTGWPFCSGSSISRHRHCSTAQNQETDQPPETSQPPGVRYQPMASHVRYRYYPLVGNILYNTDEVDIPTSARSRMLEYHPVDASGMRYRRVLRMFMTLRAYERNYNSTVWICVGQVVGDVADPLSQQPDETKVDVCGGATKGASARVKHSCRAIPTPCHTTPLKSLHSKDPLSVPPFVVYHNSLFANNEELVHPVEETRLCERAALSQSIDAQSRGDDGVDGECEEQGDEDEYDTDSYE